MLGSLILYLKGMRIMMFQLSGFYHMHSVRLRADRAHLGFGLTGLQSTRCGLLVLIGNIGLGSASDLHHPPIQ